VGKNKGRMLRQGFRHSAPRQQTIIGQSSDCQLNAIYPSSRRLGSVSSTSSQSISTVGGLFRYTPPGFEAAVAGIYVFPKQASGWEALLSQLTGVQRALKPSPGREPGNWDGTEMKVFLSQRAGELWLLYLGQALFINQLMAAAQPGLVYRKRATMETAHEWELRLSDGDITTWLSAAEATGEVVFSPVDTEAQDVIAGHQIWIPTENVVVRTITTSRTLIN